MYLSMRKLSCKGSPAEKIECHRISWGSNKAAKQTHVDAEIKVFCYYFLILDEKAEAVESS